MRLMAYVLNTVSPMYINADMPQAIIPYVNVYRTPPHHHNTNERLARNILQPLLHNRLPNLPLSPCRLQHFCPPQQHNPFTFRSTRRRVPLPNLPSDRLYRHLRSSTIPSPRCRLHPRWFRQWPRRRSLERMDGQYGERKRDTRVLARILRAWSDGRPAYCNIHDHEGGTVVVQLVLCYGESLPFPNRHCLRLIAKICLRSA